MIGFSIFMSMIALLILTFVALQIYLWFHRKQEFALAKTSSDLYTDPILTELDPEIIALVYFTSKSCAPCKTTQSPAIKALQDKMPNLEVITIDVEQEPEIAKRWHVMSLPRTFIIGKNHQVCVTNMDVTDTATLKSQIEGVRDNSVQGIQVNTALRQGFRLPKISIG